MDWLDALTIVTIIILLNLSAIGVVTIAKIMNPPQELCDYHKFMRSGQQNGQSTRRVQPKNCPDCKAASMRVSSSKATETSEDVPNGKTTS
jgi:hypothetical protein